jgi:hypothetical protein
VPVAPCEKVDDGLSFCNRVGPVQNPTNSFDRQKDAAAFYQFVFWGFHGIDWALKVEDDCANYLKT